MRNSSREKEKVFRSVQEIEAEYLPRRAAEEAAKRDKVEGTGILQEIMKLFKKLNKINMLADKMRCKATKRKQDERCKLPNSKELSL